MSTSAKKFKADKRSVAASSSSNERQQHPPCDAPWRKQQEQYESEPGPMPKETFDGQTYMHFGNKKFIFVKLNNIKEPMFVFGEFAWDEDSETWIATEKVDLNLTQFNVLTGHILTGDADRKPGQTEASTQYHLTNKLYFSWSTHNSIVSCAIRYWKDGADGQKTAMRKGISLGISSYTALKELLISMEPHRNAAAFGLVFLAKKGLQYENLKDYVRQKLFSIMEETKTQECFACQTGQSDAQHDCKTPSVLANWLDAENKLVGQRYVEGLLLLKNQTTLADVMQLKVSEYLQQHRLDLHGKKEWIASAKEQEQGKQLDVTSADGNSAADTLGTVEFAK